MSDYSMDGSVVDVPVYNRRDLTAFDDGYVHTKEKFQAMMKGMDEEMTKISAVLQAARFAGGIYSTKGPYESSSSHSVVTNFIQQVQQTPSSQDQRALLAECDSQERSFAHYWKTITASPLVVDDGFGKVLKLQFDLSNYASNEVKVQIRNNVINVSAVHEEKSDSSVYTRRYNRSFLLPQGIDPDCVTSTLSREGVLTIKAPLPECAIEDKWHHLANKDD